MFLRPVYRDEKSDDGDGGGGDDRTAEFIAAIDSVNEAEAASEAPDEPAEPAAPEPAATPAKPRNQRGQFTKAESKSEEVAESENKSEEVAEPSISETLESAGQNYLTDDLRDQGAAYGLSDDQMLTMGSEEALLNAMSLIDRYVANQAAANAPPEPPEPPAQPPAGQTPDPNAPPPPDPDFVPETDNPSMSSQGDFYKYIETLKANGYDEEITAPMEALFMQNQQMMQHMEQLQSHAAQVQQGATNNYQKQVLSLIDSLDREDLFGNDRNFTPEQAQNAEKVDHAIQWLTQTQRQPLNAATVQRAMRLAFGEQLANERIRAKVGAVKNQSNRRMGSGASSTPRADLPWDGEPSEDPAFKEFWNKAMQENGQM